MNGVGGEKTGGFGEKREAFCSAMGNLPVIVYLYGGNKCESTLLGCSEEMTGYSIDELEALSRGCESLISEEDRGEVIRGRDVILGSASGRGCLEYRMVRKDGSKGWFHEEIRVERFPDRPDIVRGVIYDISERMERLFDTVDDIRRISRGGKEFLNCETRYRSVVEDQTDFLCRFTSSGAVTFANSAYRNGFIGHNGEGEGSFFRIFTEKGKDSLYQALAMLCHERPTVTVEHRISAHDGHEQWVQWKIRYVPVEGGRSVEFQAAGRDITDLKRAEERIRFSLAEKEALLGEVHHRVKNNLQIISSLLDMSSLNATGEGTVNLIRDARSRIHTMALIHSQLMRSERFDRIDINLHVNELINHLFNVHSELRGRVTHTSSINGVYLGVDKAVPFALVLHEILSNSLKHAFPDGRSGTISMVIRSDSEGMIFADITDDGVGIPDKIDSSRLDTFGLRMIQIIVREQLGGSVELSCLHGTHYRIMFGSGGFEEKNA